MKYTTNTLTVLSTTFGSVIFAMVIWLNILQHKTAINLKLCKLMMGNKSPRPSCQDITIGATATVRVVTATVIVTTISTGTVTATVQVQNLTTATAGHPQVQR